MPVAKDVYLGDGVMIFHPELVNLYGCNIGAGCKIGTFVEIRKEVKVGRNVKIQAFAFIPEGVVIEDGAFIGPHACFTNDLYPRSVNLDGSLMGTDDWEIIPTLVKKGASIGANATILCGTIIGKFSIVGAGSVVSRDVPDYSVVAGNPAQVIGDVRDRGKIQK